MRSLKIEVGDQTEKQCVLYIHRKGGQRICTVHLIQRTSLFLWVAYRVLVTS